MPPLEGRVRHITTGEDHACALIDTGDVACWGKCAAGACDPPTGHKFDAVAAGGAHTCGVPTDRSRVLCWGVVPGLVPDGPAILPADAGLPVGMAGGATVEVSGAGPDREQGVASRVKEDL